MATEIDSDPRKMMPCFIARCQTCNAVIAASVDEPEHRKETAKFVSSLMRDGLEVSKISVADVRAAEPNVPLIGNAELVRDGHGSFNLSNGRVFDLAIADTSQSSPIHRIGLSSVSLPVRGGSSGLPRGRDKGICVVQIN